MIQIKISEIEHAYLPTILVLEIYHISFLFLPDNPLTPLSVISVHCARFSVLKFRA